MKERVQGVSAEEEKNHFLRALPEPLQNVALQKSESDANSTVAALEKRVRSWVELREKRGSLQRQFSSEKSFAFSAEVSANSRDSAASDVARSNTGKRQFTLRRLSPFGAATFNQFQGHNSASNRNFERNNKFYNKQDNFPARSTHDCPSFETTVSRRVTRFSVAQPVLSGDSQSLVRNKAQLIFRVTLTSMVRA